jgi:hypothetical protein
MGDTLGFINNIFNDNLTPISFSKILADVARLLKMPANSTDNEITDRLNDFSYDFTTNPIIKVTAHYH